MTDEGALRIIVVGAGGHAKVVIEAIRAAGHIVEGVLDVASVHASVLGATVLGRDELLPQLRAQGHEYVVVAVGDNTARERLGLRIRALGFALPTIVHPSALVSPSATLGGGVVIMARAVVGTEAVVGDLAVINTGAILDHDGHVGAAAHLAPGSVLAGNVRVGERALVGVGSAIRPGVNIGRDAVIGAGSAVIGDVPDEAIFAGVPARRLKLRVPL